MANEMYELILGGAKSGKSRTAELRAVQWLQRADHQALLLATAQAGDDEMAARIQRHQQDRAARVPALGCVEVGTALAQAIGTHSAPSRLLVVDCLTLWLTQLMFPLQGEAADVPAACDELLQVLQHASGPIVFVSNEIGLGVMPMGADTRGFIDALGLLHQRVAERCTRVTLMVAGHELAVKTPRTA